MIDTATRAATADELAMMRQIARVATDRAGSVIAAVFVFIVAFMAGVLLMAMLPGMRARFAATAAAALALPPAVFTHVIVHAKRRRSASAARGDVEDAVVEVSRVRARDAVAVEEYEDEGPGYYMILEDDRVLFLGGQYLHEHEDSFPCTEFEVVRAPRTRNVLQLACGGERLSASRTRPPFTHEEYEADAVPEDGALVNPQHAQRTGNAS